MPDGTVKHIYVRGSCRQAMPPDRLEYVGALMDVTDTKRAQEALHQAQSELAHVTRVTTLGELTASIAHEVNQPLAAIVTSGEATSDGWPGIHPTSPRRARRLGRIIRDANRASEVVKRLRALAKKTDPQMAPLDINDVINDVVALVQREVMSHRVWLRLDLGADLPPAFGDRVQLQQVVINLVMNGIEAMAPVTDRPRELLISSRPHANERMLVAVRDSGIGIDAETQDRLFTAFFTTKRDGMGMGLSICRSIIETHGGELWATTNDGPGATFQFTVPIAEAAIVMTKRSPSPAKAPAAEDPVVFVVDDDPSMREALNGLFRSVGLRVELFGSAPELLQAKLPEVASCLVLDIRLPRRSGLDFQAELAKSEIRIPIIFITGARRHADVGQGDEGRRRRLSHQAVPRSGHARRGRQPRSSATARGARRRRASPRCKALFEIADAARARGDDASSPPG